MRNRGLQCERLDHEATAAAADSVVDDASLLVAGIVEAARRLMPVGRFNGRKPSKPAREISQTLGTKRGWQLCAPAKLKPAKP